MVLAKPEHENRISHICTDNVKTGIANTLGERVGHLPHSALLLSQASTLSWPTGTSPD